MCRYSYRTSFLQYQFFSNLKIFDHLKNIDISFIELVFLIVHFVISSSLHMHKLDNEIETEIIVKFAFFEALSRGRHWGGIFECARGRHFGKSRPCSYMTIVSQFDIFSRYSLFVHLSRPRFRYFHTKTASVKYTYTIMYEDQISYHAFVSSGLQCNIW